MPQPRPASLARRTLSAGAALMLAAGLCAGPAGAVDSEEPAGDIAAVLEAGGLDPASIPPELLERVNERLDKAIESGNLTEEEIAAIEDLRQSGQLEEAIAQRIETKREERNAKRQAIVDRLAQAGIVVEEGQSIREALDQAGFERDEIRDLMKSIRPDRDDDGEADETDDDRTAVERIIDSALDRRSDRAKERQEEREERKDERDERKEERKEERDERKEERKDERDERKEERKEERDDADHEDDSDEAADDDSADESPSDPANPDSSDDDSSDDDSSDDDSSDDDSSDDDSSDDDSADDSSDDSADDSSDESPEGATPTTVPGEL